MVHQTRRPDGDRGSGTVWIACVAVILVGLVAGVALVGLAQAARHRASAAADLAALAGAQVGLIDPGRACAEAETVARANGATLTGCGLDGEIVTVQVVVQVQLGRFGLGEAVGRARAGPVEPLPWGAGWVTRCAPRR